MAFRRNVSKFLSFLKNTDKQNAKKRKYSSLNFFLRIKIIILLLLILTNRLLVYIFSANINNVGDN